MSDNKFYNTLEFDDDIDFDGLDEENVDDIDDETGFDEVIEESEDIVLPETDESEVSENIISLDSETEEENEVLSFDEPSLPDESAVNIQSEIEQTDEKIQLELNSVKRTQRSIKRLNAANILLSFLILCGLGVGAYLGYNYISSIQTELETKNARVAELEEKNNELETEYLEAMNLFEQESAEVVTIPENETEQGKIIFYDSSVGYSWMPVLTGIEQNTYKMQNFSIDDRYRMSYTDNGEESSYFGIDVSSYQGDIDWQLVKEDGVEFAFLRIGYRGYGAEGKLCPDEFFVQNYEAARDAGIDLGVYFFSQAATTDEAVEEAEYVLSLLEGRTLEYPIVFDWENIYTGDPEDIPRTDDVMPQTLTLSAIAFCETVKDAGYDAMIYTNKKLATIKYDLRQLDEYPIWLAYYDTELNYCYDFDIWQYGTAFVDGIEGEVDVNIALIK